LSENPLQKKANHPRITPAGAGVLSVSIFAGIAALSGLLLPLGAAKVAASVGALIAWGAYGPLRRRALQVPFASIPLPDTLPAITSLRAGLNRGPPFGIVTFDSRVQLGGDLDRWLLLLDENSATEFVRIMPAHYDAEARALVLEKGEDGREALFERAKRAETLITKLAAVAEHLDHHAARNIGQAQPARQVEMLRAALRVFGPSFRHRLHPGDDPAVALRIASIFEPTNPDAFAAVAQDRAAPSMIRIKAAERAFQLASRTDEANAPAPSAIQAATRAFTAVIVECLDEPRGVSLLGKYGGVEHLDALRMRVGTGAPGVRRAMAAIMARVPEAQRGGLALAHADTGALELTDE
jgi:hypothetical protein